jgi:LEA14-like dessication related protein
MANKRIFWGLGIAAVVYAAYRTANIKKSIEFFQYSLSGLKVRFNKVLQPEIIFSIQVYNPNLTSVPVNDFFGVIKKADQVLASFKNISPINLGGKETQVIEVSAKVNLISLVLKIIAGGKLDTVTVDAILKTGFFDMPIKKEISLSSLSGTDEIGRLRQRLQNGPKALAPVRHYGFLQYSNIKYG